MEIEYSQWEKGKVKVYKFEPWEKEFIAKALLPAVKKHGKKIERIKNDPLNEGQVTYQEEIRILRDEIQDILAIIREMHPGQTINI